MIVFLLHGYPNGPYMYKSLIKKLLKNGHTPVAVNFRTGVSIDNNAQLFRELIDSYPKREEKAIVAHDWGAVIAWVLYDELKRFNVKKMFIMSISNRVCNTSSPLMYKSYQIGFVISQFICSNFIQKRFVGDECREKLYDTLDSNYYYNFTNSVKYLMGMDIKLSNDPTNEIKVYYIGTKNDEILGYVNHELLSEPIKYKSHFFYKEYTNRINKQIIGFLSIAK
jgi:pimeloyl-ACP methyl ester carboxylesterase